MRAEEVYEMLNEAYDDGFHPDNLTLKINAETRENLRGNMMNLRANRPKHYEMSKFAGVDVVLSNETRLIKDTVCNSCGSDLVHHDKKKSWLCPFCEL